MHTRCKSSIKARTIINAIQIYINRHGEQKNHNQNKKK